MSESRLCDGVSADTIVLSFVVGYGPIPGGKPSSDRNKKGPTPDMSWQKMHEEIQRSLKSILLFTKHEVAVVVFTNALGLQMIQTDFVGLLHPSVKARVLFKPIMIESMCLQNYLAHMGFTWSARWALVKIFAYDMLPSCFDWVVQMDTDTILSGDIKELWDERLNFNPIQLMGGVTENQYNPRNMRKLSSKGIFVPDTNGFNTGVLLLSSQRMKEINFARDTVLSANAKLYPQWKHPDKVDPSKFYNVDQDVFNTVMLAFPSLRYQLSVKWNIQGCASFNTTMKTWLLDNRPGIFHFNCIRREIDTWSFVSDLRRVLDATPPGSIGLSSTTLL
eukprot:CAMPEP_0118924946 /NCGR_PEP_ID=MMETSP1169-20130426/2873_1 /TAXON_ID=36882 /ORGANISM="Pyramimonas obovata, Strain CCMP722" /LENGTH=333 /DNA_ID=CAMNT_0006866107 /DNA_START=330 /DNA_END=1331 /DNA_ORIENTATION=-